MWLRALTTLALFALIFVFVSPIKAFEKILACDPRFLFSAVALVPVFIFFRIFKWFLLARQADEQIRPRELVRDYLWGMALGMVTPGRLGEIARVKHINISRQKSVALFFLEKFLEVSVLFLLCFPFLVFQLFLPIWILVCGLAGIFLIIFAASRISNLFEPLKKIKLYTGQFKILGCLFFSLLCFLIFCFQGFLILKGMNENVTPVVIIFLPGILLGNLIPVTIGGFGARESLAIVILKGQNIPGEAAMGCITLVALLDLVLPALIGTFMNLNQRMSRERTTGSKKTSLERE